MGAKGAGKTKQVIRHKAEAEKPEVVIKPTTIKPDNPNHLEDFEAILSRAALGGQKADQI